VTSVIVTSIYFGALIIVTTYNPKVLSRC